MSSVGVFRKVDLDEESYWVYTLSHTDNSSHDINRLFFWSRPLSSPFFCPYARIKFLETKFDTFSDKLFTPHPINSSPHFPRTRSGDQQGESLLDCDHDDICKLPVSHLNHVDEKFRCRACFSVKRFSTSYYACLKCKEKFHRECVESPLEIKHPSHPFHSLQLYYKGMDTDCTCCGMSTKLFYHCTTCDLRMHPVCAMRTIPFVEDHPKSHPHPLTFFPTQASLVCHICGLIKNLDPTYICVQCIFVIHKGCIGFPHVIRIARHHHRISFTSSLPPGDLSCGVCHQPVNNSYGAYSCSKGEAYFVHSKCALDPKVWDGKDLDGVPEEDDMIDDGEPFVRIADGIILHPFHSHDLQLEIFKAYDEKKYCRGCALPIYEGQFYSCMEMECDYILHESCASAPRMKRHPLHPHPLTLKVATIGPGNAEGIFHCTVCYRYGTGFFYKQSRFQLDLQCASITEPFVYQGHPHPLFLPLESMGNSPCQMCKYEYHDWKLNCMDCSYFICFRCATFPYKARYKHDSHFLTICDGKEATDQPDWCEVCEGKIEEVKERWYYGYQGHNKREIRFYKCNDCSIALHVDCLLGIDINMKPANSIKDYIYFTKHSGEIEGTSWIKVQILLNSSLSRPFCIGCDRRCQFPVVFKGCDDNKIFCSWDCIGYATW